MRKFAGIWKGELWEPLREFVLDLRLGTFLDFFVGIWGWELGFVGLSWIYPSIASDVQLGIALLYLSSSSFVMQHHSRLLQLGH